MDYEDSFPTAPIRYAFDDDSDDETETTTSANTPTVTLDFTHGAPDSHNVILVIGTHGPGSVYLHSLKNSMEKIGRVVCKKGNDDTTQEHTLYRLSTVSPEQILTLPFEHEVDFNDATAYAKSILSTFSKRVKSVIVLDSFSGADYISKTWNGELIPPFLRILQTSESETLTDVISLEPPNMVKELGAAILTYCEVYNIPCYVFLSLQEHYLGKAIVTSETLDAYTEGISKLDYGNQMAYDRGKMDSILKSGRFGIVDYHHHRLYL